MTKQQGKFAVPAGDKTYHLHFTMNALCALEDDLDCSLTEIGQKIYGEQNMRIGLIRKLYRAGLVEHWPGETEPTLMDAGRVIDQVGDIQKAGEYLWEAFAAAFPDQSAQASEGKAGEGNPKKK